MTLLWLPPAAVGLSLGLTWALRRYALTHSILDVPNARSSHESPTPRGGGMAIVITFLLCLGTLWTLEVIPTGLLVALGGAGGLIALIGFVDDHHHLARGWRFGAHFAAAIWVLFWLKGLPELSVAGLALAPGALSNVLAALYIVWVVNLYNFMDGLDGIASIEAITVCAGGIIVYLAVAPGGQQWLVPAALLGAVAGFLYWNYPPARIFMGDAGSGFIGLALAVLSIHAAHTAPQLFFSWVILLGVFFVDASVTLIRRIGAGGNKYLQAHRSHAYQHAARKYRAHKPVSLAVGAINLFWLCPWAVAVALARIDGVVALLVGYIPLVWLALRFEAGRDEQPLALERRAD